MKKSVLAASLASMYLLGYLLAFNFNAPADVILFMFLLAPFIVIWMAVTILKDNSVTIPELKEGQEWGYQDKRF